ncbi:MAG: hypothetical protein DDT26_01675 [Dehalococcoidia bacterium]|nr:hypothetical protein [Chloroflexota bacterium]
MGTIKRFEDIQAWQKSRETTRQIYEITSHVGFAKDFVLRDQLRRATVSIMLNIAEGFGRRTDREFSRFLFHAHGSATEVQSALYVALDQGYIEHKKFDELYASIDEISKMLLSFSKYLLTKSED